MTEHSFLIPDVVLRTAKTLDDNGFKAFLVGGCVRDLLLHREPEDWDIATDAKPDEIAPLFDETFYENDFGTVGVVTENEDPKLKVIEVTTFRTESGYSDKRRPDSVSFSNSIDEDLKRRDFTINAIALDPNTGPKNDESVSHETLIDPFHGKRDLEARTIRAVGDPEERFAEDALRMMRAVRLSAVLNFSIDPKTQAAIEKHASSIRDIAIERIRDEFSKIIASDHPATGLFLMERLGLLREVLPEFEPAIGMEQNQAHSFSVWEHSLRTLEHAAAKNMAFPVKLAAFFHDIGKAYTREWSKKKNDWSFHGHDVVGARVTREILTRLKFPKETVSRVTKLVRWHMFFSDTDQITLSAVRRMVRNVEKENIWDLMDLRKADRIGTGRPKESPYRLRKYRSMIEEVLRDPITVGMLAINGATIMEATGSPAGPHIGSILHILLEEVLENPEKNTEEFLVKRTQELYALSPEELSALGEQAKKSLSAEEEGEIQNIRKKHWVK